MARRRQADRERILRAAAARFAEVGTLQARLDEVAAQADVARGTLYSHFPSKEALVLALMGPVLKDAVAGMDRVDRARTAQARVSAALQLYLQLWARHPDALRLSHRLMTTQDVAAAAQLHLPFVLRMVAVFSTVGRAGILRASSPELAARTLARVAVPLLELYVPVPGGETLFVEAVSGLLLKESPRTVPARRRTPRSG
ncbi:MAG: TetR/AcrR family transcriptional regulator [Myxococcota bacterium]|nr:TetR/AcrR family transcriptional regulator [Myxococcota bacterium]